MNTQHHVVIDTINRLVPYMDTDLYNTCHMCKLYSMIFADYTIVTDEDFEIHKEEFVAHMNLKHKDEIRRKREKPKVYKEFTKSQSTCGDPLCLECRPNNIRL